MRWPNKQIQPPRLGDTRIQGGFLWLPKRIDDQYRWLEHARWKQVCISRMYFLPGEGYSPSGRRLGWMDAEWIDDA